MKNKELDERNVIYRGTVEWQAKEINRQKAEIERLKEKANTPFAKITFDRDELQEMVDERVKNIEIDINLVKSEAIKEFAEKLKAYAKELQIGDNISWLVLGVGRVDQLVKEMTEKNNDFKE